jgi:hypothetical protein
VPVALHIPIASFVAVYVFPLPGKPRKPALKKAIVFSAFLISIFFPLLLWIASMAI